MIVELSTAVLEVGRPLELAIEVQRQSGPADERLDELERTRAHWEAQMEAQVLKADSTLKSASNAESRSRTMLRHAEKIVDPFDDEGEDVEATLPDRHDPGVEAEEVLQMPLGLAPNNKAHALRAKWLT